MGNVSGTETFPRSAARYRTALYRSPLVFLRHVMLSQKKQRASVLGGPDFWRYLQPRYFFLAPSVSRCSGRKCEFFQVGSKKMHVDESCEYPCHLNKLELLTQFQTVLQFLTFWPPANVKMIVTPCASYLPIHLAERAGRWYVCYSYFSLGHWVIYCVSYKQSSRLRLVDME